MRTIIVINRHRVAANRKALKADPGAALQPVIRVSRGKHGRPRYPGDEVVLACVAGRGRVIYDPVNPLPCGAAAWIEIDET
jgi:hypothetical protein